MSGINVPFLERNGGAVNYTLSWAVIIVVIVVNLGKNGFKIAKDFAEWQTFAVKATEQMIIVAKGQWTRVVYVKSKQDNNLDLISFKLTLTFLRVR